MAKINYNVLRLILIFILLNIIHISYCQTISDLNGDWKVSKIVSLVHTGYNKNDLKIQGAIEKKCKSGTVKIKNGRLQVPLVCETQYSRSCVINETPKIYRTSYSDNDRSIEEHGYELLDTTEKIIHKSFLKLLNFTGKELYVFHTECHHLADADSSALICYINRFSLCLYFGEEMYLLRRKH